LAIGAEDCYGNINATNRILSAVMASERLGYPENRIVLSAIVIELCLSPKSNSAIMAIDSALSAIRSGKSYGPPQHLQDAHYPGAKQIGIHGYLNPHNYPVQKLGAWVYQQCLPDELEGAQFYFPNDVGHEKAFADMYLTIQKAKENHRNKNEKK
jgi:putative ATPase